jgi:copper homeostasis protein (lipoprotein)
MKTQILFACALALALTNLAGCASKPAADAPAKSTATLVNTQWKLGKVGERVVTTPQGGQDIYFVLQADNQRVAGFSGCNRLMGSYALNGSQLKFDQMAGTRMACEGDGMKVEDEFLAIFPLVARWEIDGQALQLLDAGDKSLATFQAGAPDTQVARPD